MDRLEGNFEIEADESISTNQDTFEVISRQSEDEASEKKDDSDSERTLSDSDEEVNASSANKVMSSSAVLSYDDVSEPMELSVIREEPSVLESDDTEPISTAATAISLMRHQSFDAVKEEIEAETSAKTPLADENIQEHDVINGTFSVEEKANDTKSSWETDSEGVKSADSSFQDIENKNKSNSGVDEDNIPIAIDSTAKRLESGVIIDGMNEQNISRESADILKESVEKVEQSFEKHENEIDIESDSDASDSTFEGDEIINTSEVKQETSFENSNQENIENKFNVSNQSETSSIEQAAENEHLIGTNVEQFATYAEKENQLRSVNESEKNNKQQEKEDSFVQISLQRSSDMRSEDDRSVSEKQDAEVKEDIEVNNEKYLTDISTINDDKSEKIKSNVENSEGIEKISKSGDSSYTTDSTFSEEEKFEFVSPDSRNAQIENLITEQLKADSVKNAPETKLDSDDSNEEFEKDMNTQIPVQSDVLHATEDSADDHIHQSRKVNSTFESESNTPDQCVEFNLVQNTKQESGDEKSKSSHAKDVEDSSDESEDGLLGAAVVPVSEMNKSNDSTETHDDMKERSEDQLDSTFESEVGDELKEAVVSVLEPEKSNEADKKLESSVNSEVEVLREVVKTVEVINVSNEIAKDLKELSENEESNFSNDEEFGNLNALSAVERSDNKDDLSEKTNIDKPNVEPSSDSENKVDTSNEYLIREQLKADSVISASETKLDSEKDSDDSNEEFEKDQKTQKNKFQIPFQSDVLHATEDSADDHIHQSREANSTFESESNTSDQCVEFNLVQNTKQESEDEKSKSSHAKDVEDSSDESEDGLLGTAVVPVSEMNKSNDSTETHDDIKERSEDQLDSTFESEVGGEFKEAVVSVFEPEKSNEADKKLESSVNSEVEVLREVVKTVEVINVSDEIGKDLKESSENEEANSSNDEKFGDLNALSAVERSDNEDDLSDMVNINKSNVEASSDSENKVDVSKEDSREEVSDSEKPSLEPDMPYVNVSFNKDSSHDISEDKVNSSNETEPGVLSADAAPIDQMNRSDEISDKNDELNRSKDFDSFVDSEKNVPEEMPIKPEDNGAITEAVIANSDFAKSRESESLAESEDDLLKNAVVPVEETNASDLVFQKSKDVVTSKESDLIENEQASIDKHLELKKTPEQLSDEENSDLIHVNKSGLAMESENEGWKTATLSDEDDDVQNLSTPANQNQEAENNQKKELDSSVESEDGVLKEAIAPTNVLNQMNQSKEAASNNQSNDYDSTFESDSDGELKHAAVPATKLDTSFRVEEDDDHLKSGRHLESPIESEDDILHHAVVPVEEANGSLDSNEIEAGSKGQKQLEYSVDSDQQESDGLKVQLEDNKAIKETAIGTLDFEKHEESDSSIKREYENFKITDDDIVIDDAKGIIKHQGVHQESDSSSDEEKQDQDSEKDLSDMVNINKSDFTADSERDVSKPDSVSKDKKEVENADDTLEANDRREMSSASGEKSMNRSKDVERSLGPEPLVVPIVQNTEFKDLKQDEIQVAPENIENNLESKLEQEIEDDSNDSEKDQLKMAVVPVEESNQSTNNEEENRHQNIEQTETSIPVVKSVDQLKLKMHKQNKVESLEKSSDLADDKSRKEDESFLIDGDGLEIQSGSSMNLQKSSEHPTLDMNESASDFVPELEAFNSSPIDKKSFNFESLPDNQNLFDEKPSELKPEGKPEESVDDGLESEEEERVKLEENAKVSENNEEEVNASGELTKESQDKMSVSYETSSDKLKTVSDISGLITLSDAENVSAKKLDEEILDQSKEKAVSALIEKDKQENEKLAVDFQNEVSKERKEDEELEKKEELHEDQFVSEDINYSDKSSIVEIDYLKDPKDSDHEKTLDESDSEDDSETEREEKIATVKESPPRDGGENVVNIGQKLTESELSAENEFENPQNTSADERIEKVESDLTGSSDDEDDDEDDKSSEKLEILSEKEPSSDNETKSEQAHDKIVESFKTAAEETTEKLDEVKDAGIPSEEPIRTDNQVEPNLESVPKFVPEQVPVSLRESETKQIEPIEKKTGENKSQSESEESLDVNEAQKTEKSVLVEDHHISDLVDNLVEDQSENKDEAELNEVGEQSPDESSLTSYEEVSINSSEDEQQIEEQQFDTEKKLIPVTDKTEIGDQIEEELRKENVKIEIKDQKTLYQNQGSLDDNLTESEWSANDNDEAKNVKYLEDELERAGLSPQKSWTEEMSAASKDGRVQDIRRDSIPEIRDEDKSDASSDLETESEREKELPQFPRSIFSFRTQNDDVLSKSSDGEMFITQPNNERQLESKPVESDDDFETDAINISLKHGDEQKLFDSASDLTPVSPREVGTQSCSVAVTEKLLSDPINSKVNSVLALDEERPTDNVSLHRVDSWTSESVARPEAKEAERSPKFIAESVPRDEVFEFPEQQIEDEDIKPNAIELVESALNSIPEVETPQSLESNNRDNHFKNFDWRNFELPSPTLTRSNMFDFSKSPQNKKESDNQDIELQQNNLSSEQIDEMLNTPVQDLIKRFETSKLKASDEPRIKEAPPVRSKFSTTAIIVPGGNEKPKEPEKVQECQPEPEDEVVPISSRGVNSEPARDDSFDESALPEMPDVYKIAERVLREAQEVARESRLNVNNMPVYELGVNILYIQLCEFDIHEF